MTDLLAGTTPGPWLAWIEGEPDPRDPTVTAWGGPPLVITKDGDNIADVRNPDDARLLAAAPDLATENATLRQENERLKERAAELEEALMDKGWPHVEPVVLETQTLRRDLKALRSHLRDVVVPALIEAYADIGAADDDEVADGPVMRKIAAALHETQELLSDG